MNSHWREQAACRGTDPETFFPTAEDGPTYDAQVAVAKAICHRCPVRAQCLAEALDRIPYGIAGGLTPEERRTRRANCKASAAGAALDRGLRPGATHSEVAAAGLVLLTAGRPITEVATRCRVTERTVARWQSRHRRERAEGSRGSHRAPLQTSPKHDAPAKDTNSGRTRP